MLIDSDNPETNKDWTGFIADVKDMPSSCAITVSARTDGASSYDANSSNALNSTNSFDITGGEADTYYYRKWTSLVGRKLQFKMTFTSSTTTKPQLYSISLLNTNRSLL